MVFPCLPIGMTDRLEPRRRHPWRLRRGSATVSDGSRPEASDYFPVNKCAAGDEHATPPAPRPTPPTPARPPRRPSPSRRTPSTPPSPRQPRLPHRPHPHRDSSGIRRQPSLSPEPRSPISTSRSRWWIYLTTFEHRLSRRRCDSSGRSSEVADLASCRRRTANGSTSG